MKAGLLTNLILLVLLIGLVWWIQQPEPDIPSTQISHISTTDINTITITRSSNSILLKRRNDIWQLQQPYTAPANPTRIDLVLSLLNLPSSNSKTITDDMDLASFGLAEPLVTLRLNDYQFDFGDLAPLQQQRYLRFDNQLYLIDDSIAPMLTASANSFIDNRLFSEDVTINQIQWPDNKRVYLEQGQWHSDDKSLSKDQIQTYIDTWHKASALQVSPLLTEHEGDTILVMVNNQSTPISLTLNKAEHRFTLTRKDKQLAYDFPIALLPTFIPQGTP